MGRLRTVGEPRELGRCCHESVPERARPVLLGGGGEGLAGSIIAESVTLPDNNGGIVFEVPSMSVLLRREDIGVGVGESRCACVVEENEALRGESFEGEMERARSTRQKLSL